MLIVNSKSNTKVAKNRKSEILCTNIKSKCTYYCDSVDYYLIRIRNWERRWNLRKYGTGIYILHLIGEIVICTNMAVRILIVSLDRRRNELRISSFIVCRQGRSNYVDRSCVKVAQILQLYCYNESLRYFCQGDGVCCRQDCVESAKLSVSYCESWRAES